MCFASPVFDPGKALQRTWIKHMHFESSLYSYSYFTANRLHGVDLLHLFSKSVSASMRKACLSETDENKTLHSRIIGILPHASSSSSSQQPPRNNLFLIHSLEGTSGSLMTRLSISRSFAACGSSIRTRYISCFPTISLFLWASFPHYALQNDPF